MSDVDGKEVTILRVGAEGGHLDLVGSKDHSGWRFQVRTDESTLLSLLSDEDAKGLEAYHSGPWVRSWREALDQLETRYPYWRRLYPLYVEPSFRAKILEALKATQGDDESPEHMVRNWDRWAIILSDAKEITVLRVGYPGRMFMELVG